MKINLETSILLLLFLIASTKFIDATDSECGETKAIILSVRIFNGEQTSHGEWPWMASLFYSYDEFFCGGSIISQYHLLTGEFQKTS